MKIRRPPRERGRQSHQETIRTNLRIKGALIVDAACVPMNIHYTGCLSAQWNPRETGSDYLSTGFVKLIIWNYQGGMAGKQGKSIRLSQRARSIQQRRYERRSKNSFSLCIESLAAWSNIWVNVTPPWKEIPLLLTIGKLYEQQKYMYETKIHVVENPIVSISQPWLRPKS